MASRPAVQSFADLTEQLAREGELYVRVQRADGSSLEGEFLEVASTELRLRDNSTGKLVQVPAQELHGVDVQRARRGREWLLAVCTIPVATAAMVAFAQIPWVRPDRGDILIGFLLFCGIVKGLLSTPLLRRWLDSFLNRWQPLYTTALPHHESRELPPPARRP